MNRLGVAVVAAVLLAGLFAWYVKGDLEMAWLYVGPTIVGATVVLIAIASLTLPAGFPRVAAGLAALPFGMLLAWLAASTPNYWPLVPTPERMAEARRIAADTARLQPFARGELGAPVDIGRALVDSTAGFRRKVTGHLGLERREPRVRILVPFVVGPYEALRIDVAPDGDLVVSDPVPDASRSFIQPEAIASRYGATPLVEVGGAGPHSPGAVVPLRLMRAQDDWSIDVVRVLAEGSALSLVRSWSRTELADVFASELRRVGERPTRIATYFQPAGRRVTFFQTAAFDFEARLAGGGFADLRVSLGGDSLVFEVVRVRR